jgi:hypothetical protein
MHLQSSTNLAKRILNCRTGTSSTPLCGVYQTICTYSRRSRATKPAINKANCPAVKRWAPRCLFSSSIADPLKRYAFSVIADFPIRIELIANLKERCISSHIDSKGNPLRRYWPAICDRRWLVGPSFAAYWRAVCRTMEVHCAKAPATM